MADVGRRDGGMSISKCGGSLNAGSDGCGCGGKVVRQKDAKRLKLCLRRCKRSKNDDCW